MTSTPLFSTLRTRLKMACHRVYARRQKATPSLVIHMDAGTSTNWLKMLESAPSAWGGHIVDTERAFYDHGPDARATAYRKLLEQALRERDYARHVATLNPGEAMLELRAVLRQTLRERDHARDLACRLEQELARQKEAAS